MNIQIFGKSKCFDTKKAERYFKERRVKSQFIDMKKYGISRGAALLGCSGRFPFRTGGPQAPGRGAAPVFGL